MRLECLSGLMLGHRPVPSGFRDNQPTGVWIKVASVNRKALEEWAKQFSKCLFCKVCFK